MKHMKCHITIDFLVLVFNFLSYSPPDISWAVHSNLQYEGRAGSKIILCLCGTFGITSQVPVSHNTGKLYTANHKDWTKIWHQHPTVLCVRSRHCILFATLAVLWHCNLTILLQFISTLHLCQSSDNRKSQILFRSGWTNNLQSMLQQHCLKLSPWHTFSKRGELVDRVRIWIKLCWAF